MWLREHLAQRIWRENEVPGRLAQVRVKHRRQSGQGATALYTLVFNQPGDRAVEQLYVGYELVPAALDAEYAFAVSESKSPPALGRDVVRVREASLLLVAFPNDRYMRVPDDAALRACLGRVATTLASRGRRNRQVWRVKEAAFNVLRYAPGQRLTLGCCGSFEAGGGVEQPFAFVAKQFRKPNVARALHRTLARLDRHFSESHAVWLPGPIGFDKETGLVIMEELPGKDLVRCLGEVDVGDTMWRVGQMLAALHRAPRLVRKSVSVREKIRELRDMATEIQNAFPSALPRLTACLARCLAMRRSDDVPRVMLHGAFRPKHIFVHDGRVSMIDVDGMCLGDPAHDIGQFLSALSDLEAEGRLSAVEHAVAVRRFLEGYSAHAASTLQAAAVLWCTAALLVRKQARTYVVHLHEDVGRHEKVDRVLRLAEKALAACEDLPAGAGPDAICSVLC